MSKEEIALYLGIIASLLVIVFHIKDVYKFLRNCWAVTTSKVREIKDTRMMKRNNANQAVNEALEAWDFAEKYREERILYARAHGGYYPTRQEELECWETALIKCKQAVESLRSANDNRRVADWSRNSLRASKRINELKDLLHEDSVKTWTSIDEAASREYERLRSL